LINPECVGDGWMSRILPNSAIQGRLSDPRDRHQDSRAPLGQHSKFLSQTCQSRPDLRQRSKWGSRCSTNPRTWVRRRRC